MTKLSDEKLKAEIHRLRNLQILRVEQVNRYSVWLDRRRKLGKPGRVVGDTGLGKTTASRWYAFQNRATKQPNHNPKIPVLYVEITGSACSSTGLFERIIESLKLKAIGGTVNQQRRKVWHYLKQARVEVIIIDEAHRLQFNTLNDIRDLEKEANVLPILVGTSSRLDTLISKDEQVASRFACHFNFERLVGGNFQKTLKIWEMEVLCLPEPSNLAEDAKVVTFLQEKTDGQIRLLDQILRDAAVEALESGRMKIDMDVLKSIEGDYALVAS